MTEETPLALVELGPETTAPFDRTTSPAMIRITEAWKLHLRQERIPPGPGAPTPDRLWYYTLNCGPCGGFVIALTDRSANPYVTYADHCYALSPIEIRAAVMTHLYRSHGYRPDGTQAISIGEG